MNQFQPINRIGKISELIAQQIKKAILNGAIKPGDKLPPLRELGKLFQTSQISIREAIKILEGSGLINIKPGSGLFVTEISPIQVSESLSSILRIQKASIDELTEARLVFEPIVSRLAAKRITLENIQKLEKNIQETLRALESNLPAPVLNLEFHSLIAEATKNPVIALTMKTMFNVWLEWTLELGEFKQKRIKISKHSIAFHRKILEALREKNSQKVEELMLKHTHQLKRHFEEVKSNK